MISVTAAAARHLQALLADKGVAAADQGLRLLVERGGCAGMQYQMKLDAPAEGDEVVRQDGVMFIVAADSQSFLNGCQIDYEDGLADSGFRIHNPNAVRSCGCGTSFEAAPALAATQPPAEPVPCGSDP
jgi:iron-sulfur cluster assembly accessory protein